MAHLAKALVACCECDNRQILAGLVGQCGLKLVIATSSSDAVSLLTSEAVQVVFCQDELPGDGFKAVLGAAKRIGVPVIISSRLDDPDRYLESMELGAFDFICLPFDKSEVASLATRAPRRCAPNRGVRTLQPPAA